MSTTLLLWVGMTMWASRILVPMDDSQANHLKAYGVAFWVLENGVEVEWLLNYRGGSFLMPNIGEIENECVIRGVSYQVIADVQAAQILSEIADPEVNMERVKLEVSPKIAVYSPDGKQPWDDAVTLVLTYAEIPYEVVYDTEILLGELPQYDWLHLHHEDFTGQYGKFYKAYRSAAWYQEEVERQSSTAQVMGFQKVSEMKRKVATTIQEFVIGGGFLFTMCSGTDSYDIALAAQGVDICAPMYDGDPADPASQGKLDFERGLAFQSYTLEMDPLVYEFSNIDGTKDHSDIKPINDFFTLFDFSAKWDIVPTMLTQSHERVIAGFMGQTTSFRKEFIRPDVTVMGDNRNLPTAKYIHGTLGLGQWTYYGGHDPEDYRHLVNDPPTDLNLHPNSPGYRLILNNILFPAAKKKRGKRKEARVDRVSALDGHREGEHFQSAFRVIFDQEFNGASCAFGHAEQSEAGVSTNGIGVALAKHVDVSLAKGGVVHVVDVGDFGAELVSQCRFHHVAAMHLESEWRLLHGQEQQDFSFVVNESMVQHVLDGFDHNVQNPFGLLSASP